MQQITFVKEDSKRCAELAVFLMKANWHLNTQELIQLSKLLVWYNGMAQKIEAHLFDIENITPPKEKGKK